MIVLDASVLIAHLDGNDAHHERATQLLLAAFNESLAASPLILAEVLVGPARNGTLAAAQHTLADLSIRPVPLEHDAPARLAMLRARFRLRLADCCVLLAAETISASVATFDQRLADAAAELGIAVRH